MTNRFIAPELLAVDPALIESPPAGEIQELVEALRAQAKAASDASWILADAKTARNRAAEGVPNDGPGYQGLDPEQTIEWKAAEAITRLSQPAWRPIETAPLGKWVLAANPDVGPLPIIAKQYADGWHALHLDYRIEGKSEPTHWQPLPPDPPALNAALAIAAGQLGEKESGE